MSSIKIAYHDGFRLASECLAPELRVLNYSGGKQSTALLWMVLRGELPVDRSRFLVLNADPGMENSRSYEHVAAMRGRCEKEGLYFETVEGPNLYRDLLSIGTKTRIDNPAYYTQKPNGKRGQLIQKCTSKYKIAPMDRALRRIMKERGIKLREGCAEKWIGFGADEMARLSLPGVQYQRFRFPLYDMGMDTRAVYQYYFDRGLTPPPRSVCNACFANGLDTLREMHENRPRDWAQAVSVDEAVRDLSQCGVEQPVYVNDSLIPLRGLAERGFDLGEKTDKHACDSGYCFV